MSGCPTSNSNALVWNVLSPRLIFYIRTRAYSNGDCGSCKHILHIYTNATDNDVTSSKCTRYNKFIRWRKHLLSIIDRQLNNYKYCLKKKNILFKKQTQMTMDAKLKFIIANLFEKLAIMIERWIIVKNSKKFLKHFFLTFICLIYSKRTRTIEMHLQEEVPEV